MMRSIPPRLRMPLMMLVFGAVFAAAAVAGYGWMSLLHLGPVIIAGPVVYYVWGGRNSDSAAMIRQQVDERQAYRGLKIRAAGPWTPAVHALLTHLAAESSPGAPRPLGVDDQGREVLTFMEGETVGGRKPWPAWTHAEDTLDQVARWMRAYHQAGGR